MRVKRLIEPEMATSNFRFVFSLGGIQDGLLDLDIDRHADVFPDLDSLHNAGYTDQEANDLYCVLLNTTRIGVAANNIPRFKKQMDGNTFGGIEANTPRGKRNTPVNQ